MVDVDVTVLVVDVVASILTVDVVVGVVVVVVVSLVVGVVVGVVIGVVVDVVISVVVEGTIARAESVVVTVSSILVPLYFSTRIQGKRSKVCSIVIPHSSGPSSLKPRTHRRVRSLIWLRN